MIRSARRGLNPNVSRAAGKQTRSHSPKGVTGKGVKHPYTRNRRKPTR